MLLLKVLGWNSIFHSCVHCFGQSSGSPVRKLLLCLLLPSTSLFCHVLLSPAVSDALGLCIHSDNSSTALRVLQAVQLLITLCVHVLPFFSLKLEINKQ